MNPLDIMLARGVRIVLEEDLGPSTYNKIAAETQNMYGITVQEAVADFAKMDMVLRQFFGRHTTNVEARVFGRVLTASRIKDAADISILESTVASSLLATYGNSAMKAILDMVNDVARSIPEIVAGVGHSKASTYNRAKHLIREGLLREAGQTNASDGRRVAAYKSTIAGILFETGSGNLRVDARIPTEVVRYSYAFSLVIS